MWKLTINDTRCPIAGLYYSRSRLIITCISGWLPRAIPYTLKCPISSAFPTTWSITLCNIGCCEKKENETSIKNGENLDIYLTWQYTHMKEGGNGIYERILSWIKHHSHLWPRLHSPNTFTEFIVTFLFGRGLFIFIAFVTDSFIVKTTAYVALL